MYQCNTIKNIKKVNRYQAVVRSWCLGFEARRLLELGPLIRPSRCSLPEI